MIESPLGTAGERERETVRDSEEKESRKRKIEKQSFVLHIKADYHYRAIPQCGKRDQKRRGGGGGGGA